MSSATESNTALPTRVTFLQGSEEPDVTILVGEKEYKEFRQSLRCWSGYFDGAFSSGMKESASLRLTLPDRKPKEWEWIIALMSPMSEEKITMETLPIALDWFSFLCSDIGLRACDKVLSQHLQSLIPTNLKITGSSTSATTHTPSDTAAQPTSFSFVGAPAPAIQILTFGSSAKKIETNGDEISLTQLNTVMSHLETTVGCNLEVSRAICFKVIKWIIYNQVTLFTKESLQTVAALVTDNVECRSQFLGPFKKHLSPSISEDQIDIIVNGDLLHEMVYAKVEKLRSNDDELSLATARMVKIVGRYEHNQSVRRIQSDLSSDVFWGSRVPRVDQYWS